MRKLIAVFCIGLLAALAMPAMAEPTADVPIASVTHGDGGSAPLLTNAGAVCEMACPSTATFASTLMPGKSPAMATPYAIVHLVWTQRAEQAPYRPQRS